MDNRNPANGFAYLAKGLKLALSPGLRRFVIVPVLINIIVFSTLIWFGFDQFEQLMQWLLPEDSWYSFIRWLLWPLFAIAVLLIVFYTFTVIANLIAAPFNALLAERCEQKLTGQAIQSEGSAMDALKTVVPAILGELRKMLYFIVRALPLLLLFVIPILNIAAPVIWFLFGAWFIALEYADYPMGNHSLEFRQQLDRLRKKRVGAFSFGTAVTLMMMVPVLNFLAMPAAVCGATVYWVDSLSKLETGQ